MLLNVALVLLVWMLFWYVISIARKDNTVADTAWGLGFVLVAFYSLLSNGLYLPRQIAITVLVCIWGFRLAYHVMHRNIKKGEDPRYAKMREGWGKYYFIRSLFQVYLLQGFLLLIVSYPIYLVNYSFVGGMNFVDFIGIGIWIIGFFFESIGDAQLKRFISDQKNKGKIMQYGLWRYTRHPNYFGESLMWWGIFISALNVNWTSVISPIAITCLLLFVSGIPLAERGFKGNIEFQEYKKRTSAFIPWFPKR